MERAIKTTGDFYEDFDKGTGIKLDLMSQYLESWMLIFLVQKWFRRIKIIDFFSGPGKDDQGADGSPLRILKTLEQIFKGKHGNKINDKKIEIVFNDKDQNHISNLKKHINDLPFWAKAHLGTVQIQYKSKDFKSLFNEMEKELRNSANFIFLNQFGVKEVIPRTFKTLFSFNKTDFIFFISSSSFKRFASRPEFKDIDWIDKEKATREKPTNIHRFIASEYRKMAPEGSYVIPFSIQKKGNTYGLVFCTKSIRGADEFLRIAWKKNDLNGEANFDIDNDEKKRQLDLFQGKTLTKIQEFQVDLRNEILNSNIKDNVGAYRYTISNGFIPEYAKESIMQMKKDGLLEYEGRLALSYQSCVKNEKRMPFRPKGNQ